MSLQLRLELSVGSEDPQTLALRFSGENALSTGVVMDAPIAAVGPTARRRVLNHAERFVEIGILGNVPLSDAEVVGSGKDDILVGMSGEAVDATSNRRFSDDASLLAVQTPAGDGSLVGREDEPSTGEIAVAVGRQNRRPFRQNSGAVVIDDGNVARFGVVVPGNRLSSPAGADGDGVFVGQIFRPDVRIGGDFQVGFPQTRFDIPRGNVAVAASDVQR